MRYATLALLLSLVGALAPQPRLAAQTIDYTFGSVTECSGATEVTVDVFADGFTDVLSASFTLEWDETALGFDYTDASEGPINFNPALPALGRSSFGFGPTSDPGQFVANGQTTFGFVSSVPGAGSSVPAGERLFSLRFQVLDPNAVSAVELSGALTSILSYFATPGGGAVGQTTWTPATVAIGDAEAPTLACATPPTTTAAQGATSALVGGLASGAADNCDLATVTYALRGATAGASPATGINDPSSLTFNVGTTTLTYVATDAAGLSDSCSVDVVVEAATAPPTTGATFTLPDVNLACSASGLSVDVVVDGFTDVRIFQGSINFDPAELSYDPGTPVTNFTTAIPGWGAGNLGFADVANGNITFVYAAPSGTLVTLQPGEVLFSLPLSIIATPTADIEVSGTPTALRVQTVTGGVRTFVPVSTESSTVTLTDTEPPVVDACPAAVNVDADAGACEALVAYPTPSATDLCDGPIAGVLTAGLPSGSTFPVGATTVTYTFTDAAGNSSACTFEVTVADNEAPAVTCPADLTVTAPLGQCFAQATWATPTVTDNCDASPALTFVPQASGTNFALGVTTVTYTATDDAGNSSTCSFTVTVLDAQAPEFTLCPGTQNVAADAGTCGFGGSLPIPVATDDCGTVTVQPLTPIPSPLPVGATDITYVATDDSGNEATCTFTVNVIDQTDPTVADCPMGPIALTTAPGACEAVAAWPEPTFSDACGPLTVTSSAAPGDLLPVGTTTVTYTATDGGGNSASCAFDVVVSDAEAPTLSGACGTTVEVDAAATECEAVVTFDTPVATDACDASPAVRQIAGPASGSAFPVGTTAVSFEAEDASGNVSAVCSFDVVVRDATAPTLTCPADQSYQLDPGNTAATAPNIGVTADDACGVASTTYAITGATQATGQGDASNLAFEIGVSTVTYTVTDVNGNAATCSFTVTVLAPTGAAPAITCPADVQEGATAPDCARAVTGIALQIDSDPTEVASVTYEITGATTGTGADDASGEVFAIGTSTVTYTATGTSGMSASCSFEVVIVDVSAPSVVSCPADTIELFAAGAGCLATAVFDEPIFAAGCTPVNVTSNVVPGGQLPRGLTDVVYTATGANGAQASCSFVLRVRADGATFADCPTDITVAADPDACEAVVTWTEPTAVDDCGDPVAITASHRPGEAFRVGRTTVIYRARTARGRTVFCNFDVIVTDDQAPTIDNCPADITVAADAATCAAVVSWPAITASDNCPSPSVTTSVANGSSLPVGDTVVTVTATDRGGNVTTCSFRVTVTDDAAPRIDNCPADITVAVDAGTCEATVTWPPITASDACGPVAVATSVPNGARLPAGQTTVLVSATDANGNVDTCSFEVTVTGATGGIAFDCPAGIVYRADGTFISDPDGFLRSGFSAGCDALFVDFDLPAASSGCGDPVTVEQIGGQPSGAAFPIGFTNLLFRAVNARGDTALCDVSIEIRPEPVAVVELIGGPPCVGDDVALAVPPLRNAAVTWTTPAGATVAADTLRLSDVTLDDAGLYLVRTVTEGGCEQVGSFDLAVGAAPEPTITTPDFVCGLAGGDLVLQVEDAAGADYATYAWTGPNGFASALATPIIENVTPAASGTYAVTVTSVGGCGSATVSKAITVGTQPNAPLVTVSDATPCIGETVIFAGTPLAGVSVGYDWQVTPRRGATLTPLNFTAQLRADEPGQYTVCYTVTVDGCDSEPTCTTIVVDAAPALTITGADSIACTDGTEDLELLAGPTMAFYTWRGPTGAVLSTSPRLFLPDVTAANAGVYTLNATSLNGCPTDTAINVRITERPQSPVLQTDRTAVCLGESATLSATDLGGGVDYLWSADATAGIPSLSNRPSITVTPTAAGTYAYALRAERDGCLSDLVDVTLEVSGTPAVDVSIAGDVTCVGQGASVTLVADAAGQVTYAWTGPNGFASAEATPTLTNVGDEDAGVYEVTVTNAAGCSTAEAIRADITAGLGEVGTFFDGDLCRGETVQLFAESFPGARYAWSGPNGFESDDQNPVLQSLSPGLAGGYAVVATLPNGCSSTGSEELVLEVLAEPAALADRFEYTLESGSATFDVLGNDDLAAGDFSVTLTRAPAFGNAAVGADGTISYTSTLESPREDRFEYEVCYLECPDQCARALVSIGLAFSREECIATNLITPNGDGENDAFYISCVDDPDLNPRNRLVIYNEYGDEVYSASPYRNDWEGTFEGADVPDGAYYYIFSPGPGQSESRGSITVYR